MITSPCPDELCRQQQRQLALEQLGLLLVLLVLLRLLVLLTLLLPGVVWHLVYLQATYCLHCGARQHVDTMVEAVDR